MSEYTLYFGDGKEEEVTVAFEYLEGITDFTVGPEERWVYPVRDDGVEERISFRGNQDWENVLPSGDFYNSLVVSFIGKNTIDNAPYNQLTYGLDKNANTGLVNPDGTDEDIISIEIDNDVAVRKIQGTLAGNQLLQFEGESAVRYNDITGGHSGSISIGGDVISFAPYHVPENGSTSQYTEVLTAIDDTNVVRAFLEDTELWEFSLSEEPTDVAAEYENDVRAAADSSTVYFLDSNGDEVDTITPSISGTITSIDCNNDGDIIYIGTSDGTLLSYEQSDGEWSMSWEFDAGTTVEKVVARGNPYILQDDGIRRVNEPFTKRVDDVSNLSISKNVNSKNAWSADVPFDRTFDELIEEEVEIYHMDDELIFKGLLKSTNHGDTRTSLDGYGTQYSFEQRVDSVEYTMMPLNEIIADYWERVGINATTLDPLSGDIDDASVICSGDDETHHSWTSGDNNNIIARQDSDPYRENAEKHLEILDTAFTTDAQELSSSTVTEREYSGEEAVDLAADSITFNADYEYTPKTSASSGNNHIDVFAKLDISLDEDDVGSITLLSDGEPQREWTIDEANTNEWVSIYKDTRWDNVSDMFYWERPESAWNNDFTLEASLDGEEGAYIRVDCVSIVDSRFSYTLEESPSYGEYYRGPESIPPELRVNITQQFQASEPNRFVEFNELSIEADGYVSDWGARITVPDGPTISRTQSNDSPVLAETLYWNDVDTVANVDKISIIPNRVDSPTRSGEVNHPPLKQMRLFWKDYGDYVFIDYELYEGTVLETLQTMHEYASYNFSKIEPDDVYESYPIGTTKEWPDSIKIIDYDDGFDFGDYANRVIARGTSDDGESLVVEVEDVDEIFTVGKDVETEIQKPDISRAPRLRQIANNVLRERIQEREREGTMTAAPSFIEPGYSYDVPVWDETATLQEVSVGLGSGDTLSLDFEFRRSAEVAIRDVERQLKVVTKQL